MIKDSLHLCFITNGFPSVDEPYAYTFLDQLITEIADLGVRCTVINPVSLTRYFSRLIPPAHSIKTTQKKHEIQIFRPRFVSFSARRFWKINTAYWTFRTFSAAAERSIRENNLSPDAFYGHFIYSSGITCASLSKQLGIPAFCAVGEGAPWSIDMLGAEQTRQLMANGNLNLMAVSTSVKKMLLDHRLGMEQEIPVFPNGVNLETFHLMDQVALREKYGFPKDGFLVIYVGKFGEKKGIFRLIEATQGMKDVYSIFLGDGECETDPETTLFKGKVPQCEVPLMLNTADIFVLPTRIEGCSNAIIEALACGLPIVSSNYDFNEEILDEFCSIRVDPLNVSEIRQAILTLKNDPEIRKRMSQAALEKAKQLDLQTRAKRILKWIESRIPSRKADCNKESV